MAHNSDNLRLSPGSDLSVHTFDEIESTSPELPTPAFITDAVRPEIFRVKWRKRLNGVTNKASCGMGVESEQEWNEQMMGVPERLERLLANLMVRSGVHEKHAKEHDMACDASSFCVVNLDSGGFPNLRSLNVEEAAVVSKSFM
jgi:hypothetical protein